MVGHASFRRMIATARQARKSAHHKFLPSNNGRIVNIRKFCRMKVQSQRENHPDSGQQQPSSFWPRSKIWQEKKRGYARALARCFSNSSWMAGLPATTSPLCKTRSHYTNYALLNYSTVQLIVSKMSEKLFLNKIIVCYFRGIKYYFIHLKCMS